ncbi:hypothetical protein [Pseudoxanthomonas putridarboris]|uniref:Uncharacterized protein n=1 Tax=Pseudoxanthomonas putridarboris TaxID=752605 RepID=A0ABU9IX02_9GAMM
MKHTRISYALIVALAGSVAIVGCKKKEEAVVPPPTAVEPAPAPIESAPAPVSATSVTVGNAAAADKSVAAVSTFGVKDKIIVSVTTDAATPANAAIDAKLTYQDGQVAGQQTANVVAGGVDTTNVEFTKATDWPVGKYKVDVTLNGQPVGFTQEIEVK